MQHGHNAMDRREGCELVPALLLDSDDGELLQRRLVLFEHRLDRLELDTEAAHLPHATSTREGREDLGASTTHHTCVSVRASRAHQQARPCAWVGLDAEGCSARTLT